VEQPPMSLSLRFKDRQTLELRKTELAKLSKLDYHVPPRPSSE
jgi:hypothetical protein